MNISWFDGADEGAHEFAVHLRRDGIGIDAGGGEEFTRVRGAIDAS